MTPPIPTTNSTNHTLKWMLITASPDVARFAEEVGVHRIFVDMEVLGKAERQGHLNTHKASHTLEDVAKVREVLQRAELMVRLNPLNRETEDEVNAVISHGAQRLMLPMFQSGRDVQVFLKLVDGRVPVTFLLETPQALVKLPTYISHLREQDHIHIGLNDLSLGLGADFLFEPIAAGLIDPAAALLNDYGLQWGFGGIARVGGGALPAEWILSEHVRLGSKWVILSRAFHGGASTVEELTQQIDLVQELENLRVYEHKWQVAGEETLKQNREQFIAQTFAIAEGKATVRI